MIIEWNTHMFSRDVGRFPFHEKAVYTPDVSRLALDPLADYLSRMDAEGIDRAVLVHPEPYGDDHSLVLDCLDREKDRLWGTCLFYPEDPDAKNKLRDLIDVQPRIVALRFHAHRGKEMYLDSFLDSGVIRLWQTAVELGLIIELHIGPNFGREVGEVIRNHPRSRVLIDHLGEPHMGSAVEYADVLALAGFDHVYMKLSGINHFCDDGPLFPSARNFTRQVVDAFGPERMVWGSGSPGIVDAHLGHLLDPDRRKVKGENLLRLLGKPGQTYLEAKQ